MSSEVVDQARHALAALEQAFPSSAGRAFEIERVTMAMRNLIEYTSEVDEQARSAFHEADDTHHRLQLVQAEVERLQAHLKQTHETIITPVANLTGEPCPFHCNGPDTHHHRHTCPIVLARTWMPYGRQ